MAIVVPLAGFALFTGGFFLLEDQMIFYFKDDSALFAEYYLYLIPLVLFVLYFEVLNSYYQALQDSVTGSFLNEVVVRALTVVLLIIHHYEFINFAEFVLLYVLTYGLQPVYLLYALYKRNELSFAIPFQSGNKRFAKLISVYGLYSLVGGITTVLVTNIDILMLSAMTDLSSTAIYFIAFSVGSVIAVPQRSIFKIAFPLIADFIKNKKWGEVASMYRRTSLNQLIFGALIFVGIWANMHNLMDLLPPDYQGAEWVIIVIGFAKLFDMSTGINGGIILNSRYYRFHLYLNILLVFLTVLTNYLLIPPYGILGAAIATAISIFIYNVVKYFFVLIKLSMQPFEWNTPVVLLIAAGCLLLSFQLPYLYNFFVDVTVRSLAIAIVFFGSILGLGLSNDVRNLFDFLSEPHSNTSQILTLKRSDMKAIHVINPGKNSSLEISESPTPQPAKDEILVKIKATAVNRADLHQRSGNYPPPEGAPDILGLEMAGVVEKAGTDVEKWSVGDRVFGLLPGGGYAEYCTIPEELAMPIPPNLSFNEAAAIPETFLTAFQALELLGELQRGETVLIHAGGSGVGTAAIQLAHQLCNARVISTAGKEHKLETCRKLGADFAYNYKAQNYAEEIRENIGKTCVDLVIDFIGAPYWEKNIDVLAMDGRVVYLSFLGGHRLESMSLAPLLRKRLKIMGSTLRSRTVAYKAHLTRQFLAHAYELLEAGTLRPIIDSEYDWSDTEQAHTYMANDKNTGKIVLTGM